MDLNWLFSESIFHQVSFAIPSLNDDVSMFNHKVDQESHSPSAAAASRHALLFSEYM